MDVRTFGTALTVTLVAEDGRERVLHGDSLLPTEWRTISLGLAPWAGQLVLLRFLPEARPPGDYPDLIVRRLALRTRPSDASASRSAPPSERPNVVVYLIDALRADHLGCYGYDRPTSPRIDQFAHSGLLFSDAVAQSSWTLPSTASILTGRTPRRHGAMAVDMAIRPDVATLAERFQGAGYRTAAFVTNYLASTEYGLARGFDHFRLYREEAGRRAAVYLPSAALRRRVRRWLEREVDHGPFFLYVHATDPHWPYLPAARHARPFRAAAMTDAEERRVVDASRSFFFGNEHHMERPTSMPASRVAVLRDLYDGDVRAADEGFGRLLDDLAALGLLERTVVVLTADHGEEFRDHDGLGHGQTLHREVLHVPLVVRLPGGARGGERIARTVQHVDIAPTVLDLAGIDRSDDLEGRSLLDDAPPDVPVVLSQLDNLGFVFDGVTTPRLKAIRSLSDPTPGLAPITVYDREQDPDERRDVARIHPVFAGYARQQLRAAVAAVRPGPPVPPDKLERLRALGYIEP
jgi:arylsulfatase A-like enzyme